MLQCGEDELSGDIRQVYEEHWSSVHTHHHTNQRIQDVYNYRLPDVNSTLLAAALSKSKKMV